ncbi:MAG: phosphatidate cytidylyltransferase [Frankiaceae bacterium]|nr:phosphatidate cytidylyltransferase [Frankiaceae bacterium]MBV9369197.1 phosphatidate cytidylyltransferase [Frankiales bacterium]
MSEVAPAPARAGRAGRNLPVAIAVGLALGAVILLTLYLLKPAFLAVVAIAVGIGLWELVSALHERGLRAPVIPLEVGLACILALAYTRGREAMTVAMMLTALAIVVWRAAEGADGMLADIGAGLLVLVYVAFLAGFAALMLAPSDGDRRVTAFIATVVASDVGGYAFGVLFGRHLMAPTVSPKKSWEGLVGSAIACVLCGAILFETLFRHGHWWQGAVFGLGLVASATVGDLGESMIKRDLGIKDMGTLLPGHGGLMDRLDSLLPSAPVAWLLLAAFIPVR